MKHRLVFFCSLFCFCLFFFFAVAGMAGAAESGTDAESIEQEADQLRRKIEKTRSRVDRLGREEKGCMERLDEAERSLQRTRKRIDGLQREVEALTEKIEDRNAAIEELAAEIAEIERIAEQRMVALYKLRNLGEMNFLASAGSVNELYRRKSALSRILAHDAALLRELGQKRSAHTALLSDLQQQRKQKRALEADRREQAGIMAAEKDEREKLLEEIRKRKSYVLASLKSLKKSAAELDEKIKALEEERRRHEAPVGFQSTKPFTSFKGLLNMPVKGKIISSFGPYRNTEFNVLNFQNGIDIQAEKGTPIRAVRPGRVLYSSWFKGYGNLIIIDHGKSYYTLYAHAQTLSRKVGDTVGADDVIAAVGDTGSLKGPMLHFEIRHHGNPIDPMKWIKKS